MTPDFSSLVNPTFNMVLTLVEHIEQGERPNLAAEQDRIRAELNDAEATASAEKSGIDIEHFRLAKYALVCWTDELLTAATRNSGTEYDWSQAILERKIYGSRNRAWKFFATAELARKYSIDALETFYLGVVLGFEGDILDAIDRSRQPGETPEIKEALAALKDRIRLDGASLESAAQMSSQERVQLNANALKQWSAETYHQIRDRRGGEKEPFAQPLEGDVRPLWGRNLLRASILGFSVLALLLLVLLAIRFSIGKRTPPTKSPRHVHASRTPNAPIVAAVGCGAPKRHVI